MRPYLFMSAVYLVMAGLMALDASLTSLALIPGHQGIVWLRIHLITLGTVSQAWFGVLPALTASRAGRPRPATRWDIFLAFNAGLLLLVIGVPLVNGWLMVSGGALIFAAAGLLIAQLRGLRAAGPEPAAPAGATPPGRPFYIAGLAYLLLGVVVGSGLWLGWGQALRIAVPIEVHIHANNWGFMALVFAGLLADLFPRLTGRPLASPAVLSRIFWMMTAGALGLVVGPWVTAAYALVFSVPGLVLHLGSTAWLLALAVRGFRAAPATRGPGPWHIVTSYFWFLAPVLIAPLIIFNVPGFPGAGIEANAPQALVYGWVLHFAYALVPYLLQRVFLPDRPARLGGSWLSLAAAHLGGALLWAGIFFVPVRDLLRGLAYGFWLVSLLPAAVAVVGIVRAGLARFEQQDSIDLAGPDAPAAPSEAG